MKALDDNAESNEIVTEEWKKMLVKHKLIAENKTLTT